MEPVSPVTFWQRYQWNGNIFSRLTSFLNNFCIRGTPRRETAYTESLCIGRMCGGLPVSGGTGTEVTEKGGRCTVAAWYSGKPQTSHNTQEMSSVISTLSAGRCHHVAPTFDDCHPYPPQCPGHKHPPQCTSHQPHPPQCLGHHPYPPQTVDTTPVKSTPIKQNPPQCTGHTETSPTMPHRQNRETATNGELQ